MFKRQEVTLRSDPTCNNPIDEFFEDDFAYYDKDGFELNIAERKYYAAVGHPLGNCLNHVCWQEPWFKLEDKNNSLILDHCIFLCRANYTGEALAQIKKISQSIPQAKHLINTRQKWGYDFALDAQNSNNIFEVLHVEFDSTDYDRFSDAMVWFDYKVRHTDWQDAADKIWAAKDQWQHLIGFEQNNWKAKYLLGWSKAEYTEKSLAYK